ncbi:MAG: DUF805 domain-containing protein [Selenomonadaceae bacterium]|nr:DUF805 domain-containing protein [Selenomonadaceae bacterium]
MNDKTIPEIFFKREGRLNRWRYFKRNVVLGIISSFIMVVIELFFGNINENISTTGNVLLFVAMMLILVPSYCLVVRRLHDMDRDELLAKVYIAGCAASYFLSFVLKYDFMPLSVVMVIVALYILFVPGTYGTNKYGADPLNN